MLTSLPQVNLAGDWEKDMLDQLGRKVSRMMMLLPIILII